MSANKSLTKKWRLRNALKFLTVMAVGIVLLANTPLKAQEQTSQDIGPVLKAYACPPAIIDGTAARLKEKFKGQSDVRISASPRTAQILVYAPAETQAQIAECIAGINGATESQAVQNAAVPLSPQPPGREREASLADGLRKPGQPPSQPNRSYPVRNPVAATDARASKSVSIALQNISGRQLEQNLLSMLGNRLTALPPEELGTSSFQSILPGGRVVRLDILLQLNRSALSGTATAVDSFARLIKILDAPPAPAMKACNWFRSASRAYRPHAARSRRYSPPTWTRFRTVLWPQNSTRIQKRVKSPAKARPLWLRPKWNHRKSSRKRRNAGCSASRRIGGKSGRRNRTDRTGSGRDARRPGRAYHPRP